ASSEGILHIDISNSQSTSLRARTPRHTPVCGPEIDRDPVCGVLPVGIPRTPPWNRSGAPFPRRDVRADETEVLHTRLRITPSDLGEDRRAHELKGLRPRRRIALHRQEPVRELHRLGMLRGVASRQLGTLADEILTRQCDLPAGLTAEGVEDCGERSRVTTGSERRVLVIVADASLALPALGTGLEAAQPEVGRNGLGCLGVGHSVTSALWRSSVIVPAWMRTTCRCSS